MIFDQKQQETILPLVLLAAGKAAEEILAIHSNPDKLVIESKWDGSYVTNADIASQEVMEKILALHITGIPIVSEENDVQVPADGAPHFLIDPLDGTSRFIKSIERGNGGRGYINITLVEKGVPRLAVIYDLTIGEVYATYEGIESFAFPSLRDAWANANQTEVMFDNAEELQIRSPKLSGEGLDVCFNARTKLDQRYDSIRQQVVRKLPLPPSHIIGETLTGIESLLRGRMDVAIRSNPNWESGYPHDIAPWWLLTKNAGGETVFLGDKPTTVADFSDRNTRMPGLIAMHRDTAQPFVEQP